MEVSIDRRVSVPGGKDLKFTVTVRSLDGHMHGELTRSDQQAVRDTLVHAGDAIVKILTGKEPEGGPANVQG